MVKHLHPDRINNFCDAVFAIAMTLLILEIKVPEHDDLETLGLTGSLLKLIPSFIGFFISFFVIALFWRAHLTMASIARSYHQRQLWLTVGLLFFIVLLPFSTGLYARYFGDNQVHVFYFSNLALIGLFYSLLVFATVKNESSNEKLNELTASWMKARSLTAPIGFAFAVGWVFVEPYSARFLFLLIFVAQAVVDRRFKLPTTKST